MECVKVWGELWRVEAGREMGRMVQSGGGDGENWVIGFYIWFGGRDKTCQTVMRCDKERNLGCLFVGLGNGGRGRAEFSEKIKWSM